MILPSRFWADLSARDFAHLQASGEAAEVVAVLPVAAIEQHGPHLPLSVDTALVDGIVAASLAHLPATLPVLFLPTQAVGLSPEHQRFAGTLTLSPETVIRLWVELGECVARAGVRKLLLFNSHGGQVSVLDIVARELRSRCNLIVYGSSWFNLPLPPELEARFGPDEHRFGIHAGDIETSMMLALQPERVDLAQARHVHSSSQDRAARYTLLGNGRSAKLGWQMQDYNPAGAAGNAAAATADKGHALIDAAARQLALLLQEIAHLPLSTLVDKPQFSQPNGRRPACGGLDRGKERPHLAATRATTGSEAAISPSWSSSRPTTKESARRRATPRRPAPPPGGSECNEARVRQALLGFSRPTTKESGRRRAAPRRPAAPLGDSDHTK